MRLRRIRRRGAGAAVLCVAAAAACSPAIIRADEEPAITATPHLALDEAATAGPLHDPMALRVDGDALWIVDGGNHRVVRAHAEAADVVVFGRRGAGPGEFERPWGGYADGEGGVRVWDRGLRRVTRISRQGPLATEIIDASVRGLMLTDVLPLGNRFAAIFNRSADATNPPDERADSLGIVALLSPDDLSLDTLAVFPQSGPIVRVRRQEDGLSLSAFSSPFDAPPHADATPACGGFAAFSVGGREHRVLVLGPSGERVAELTDPRPGEPVTATDRERYYAQFPPEVERRHQIRRTVAIPERHAAVQALRTSGDGHVWVRTTPAGDGRTEARWSVWVPEGGAGLAAAEWRRYTVELPARFRLQDARGDVVWGFAVGAHGEQSVAAYRLSHPLPRGCQGRE